MPINEPFIDADIALTTINGHLTADDITHFSLVISNYAHYHKTALGIILDATRMEFIGINARLTLAELTHQPYVTQVVFVSNNPLIEQMVHSIEILGNAASMRTVATIKEARTLLARRSVGV